MKYSIKNKPYPADELPTLCFCRFTDVGLPLDSRECKVHSGMYGCDKCHCYDYRPSEPKVSPGHWPKCVCGHIAQEHNTRTQ